MSLMLGRFEFDGPYATADRLPTSAGVFAILCFEEDGAYRIDIDHCDDLRNTVSLRKEFGPNQAKSTLSVAIMRHSARPDERQSVVNELKAEYNQDCTGEIVAA